MVPGGCNSLLNYPQTHQLRGKKKTDKEERRTSGYVAVGLGGTSSSGRQERFGERPTFLRAHRSQVSVVPTDSRPRPKASWVYEPSQGTEKLLRQAAERMEATESALTAQFQNEGLCHGGEGNEETEG